MARRSRRPSNWLLFTETWRAWFPDGRTIAAVVLAVVVVGGARALYPYLDAHPSLRPWYFVGLILGSLLVAFVLPPRKAEIVGARSRAAAQQVEVQAESAGGRPALDSAVGERARDPLRRRDTHRQPG